MNQKLSELIIADHRRLQRLAEELRKECAQTNPSEGACFLRFRTLKALFSAQTKAEEYTIYNFVEENPSVTDAGMGGLVYESYEEHDLAEFVLIEMGQAEEITQQWRSQLKVFTELLNRHVEKEESEILPQLIKRLDNETLMRLGEHYVQERDQIFAKKSGPKSPTLPYYSSDVVNSH